MKAIINGFRYDTEAPKTTEIFRYSYSNPSDFRYEDFGVYRTARGNWFLAGRGGAMTRFARRVEQNSTCGGERIIPLQPREVLALADQCELDEREMERLLEFNEIAELVSEA